MLKKIEEFLFYLLLFSIPFQTRVILWQQNWYFNEWQSMSLYGTDVLLLVLFYFWFRSPVRFRLAWHDYFLLLFLLFSGLSVLNSSHFITSAYQFIKLLEFILFYFYVKNYALLKINVLRSFLAIAFGGLLQSVISIWQFSRQSDLGLRLLGETLLRPDMAGVATFINAVGEKIMRPYGTTPHPNVLAAYLFVAVFSFYAYFLYRRGTGRGKLEYVLLTFYGVLLFAFLLTFSRTVIFVFLVGISIRWALIAAKKLLKKDRLRVRLGQILVVSVIVGTIFSFLYWPEIKSRATISASDEAVSLRIHYNKESLSGGMNLLGVGIGNFVNWMMEKEPYHERWFYQPVHNIYLLIYAEIGLVGLAFFILFLIFLFRNFVLVTGLKTIPEYSILLMAGSLIFIGFFDHFLWTIQQGRFIFWLILAVLDTNYTQKIIQHA